VLRSKGVNGWLRNAEEKTLGGKEGDVYLGETTHFMDTFTQSPGKIRNRDQGKGGRDSKGRPARYSGKRLRKKKKGAPRARSRSGGER